MWDESIAANRASAEASRAYAAMRHRDATEAEELHALDYMAYSYLQEAQDAEAKKIVDHCRESEEDESGAGIQRSLRVGRNSNTLCI